MKGRFRVTCRTVTDYMAITGATGATIHFILVESALQHRRAETSTALHHNSDRLTKQPTETKVANLDVVLRVEEDVLRLQVAM